jgi:hypothetical protein
MMSTYSKLLESINCELLEALKAVLPQVWVGINDGCVTSEEEYEKALRVVEKVERGVASNDANQ